VVEGIKYNISNAKEQLMSVGKFLCDANLLGFSLEELTEEHMREITRNRYLSTKQILQEDPNSNDIPEEVLETILNQSIIKQYTTRIHTGYGTKREFVLQKNSYRFKRAIVKQLQNEKIPTTI